MKNKWKSIAIIFMCLFIALLSLNIYGYVLVVDEDDATYDCYYNICSDFPQALYEAGVCTCYTENENGEYEVAKTTYK